MNRLADYNYTFMGSSHADKLYYAYTYLIDTLLFPEAEMFTPVSGSEVWIISCYTLYQASKNYALYLYQFP